MRLYVVSVCIFWALRRIGAWTESYVVGAGTKEKCLCRDGVNQTGPSERCAAPPVTLSCYTSLLHSSVKSMVTPGAAHRPCCWVRFVAANAGMLRTPLETRLKVDTQGLQILDVIHKKASRKLVWWTDNCNVHGQNHELCTTHPFLLYMFGGAPESLRCQKVPGGYDRRWGVTKIFINSEADFERDSPETKKKEIPGCILRSLDGVRAVLVVYLWVRRTQVGGGGVRMDTDRGALCFAISEDKLIMVVMLMVKIFMLVCRSASFHPCLIKSQQANKLLLH